MSVAEYLMPEEWLSADAGPLYVQLRRRIEAGIKSGFLAPGMPIPPEREIAHLTGLSRVTVRKAIADLVGKGQIVQKQGSGSSVAPAKLRVEQSLSRLTSFSEDMARRGLKSEVRWLERGLFLPTTDEALTLGLGANDQVSRLSRLRLADGRPMALERAALPTDILPNPLIVDQSLYEVLGLSGKRPVRAIQKISAINLSAEDCAALDVRPNAAGLRIERIAYLKEGRAIEFTRSLYRGDAYDFVAEMRLSDASG